jgi:hypothetical protein
MRIQKEMSLHRQGSHNLENFSYLFKALKTLENELKGKNLENTLNLIFSRLWQTKTLLSLDWEIIIFAISKHNCMGVVQHHCTYIM